MNREKVREVVIGRLLFEFKFISPMPERELRYNAEQATDKILSIPEILIKAEDQSLPENPTWCSLNGKSIRGATSVYGIAQQDMLNDKWVKVEKKDEG